MSMAQTGSRYDREYRGAMLKIRLIAVLLLLLVLALRFVVGFAFVRGDGMQPTYMRGRPLIFLRLGTEYRRNDIVLVTLPDGTSAPLRVLGAYASEVAGGYAKGSNHSDIQGSHRI